MSLLGISIKDKKLNINFFEFFEQLRKSFDFTRKLVTTLLFVGVAFSAIAVPMAFATDGLKFEYKLISNESSDMEISMKSEKPVLIELKLQESPGWILKLFGSLEREIVYRGDFEGKNWWQIDGDAYKPVSRGCRDILNDIWARMTLDVPQYNHYKLSFEER